MSKDIFTVSLYIYSKILIMMKDKEPHLTLNQQILLKIASWFWFGLVFCASFNNISVISWWSALLMEETRVPGENH